MTDRQSMLLAIALLLGAIFISIAAASADRYSFRISGAEIQRTDKLSGKMLVCRREICAIITEKNGRLEIVPK
jgi:hypothetical protein